MMQTTLRRIRAAGPCGMRLEDGQRVGYLKLRHHLGEGWGDDTPVDIATIIDSNGLDDALWCLRAVDGHSREMRLYAVWCARQMQSLLKDPRSLTALDVAERYANGAASKDELAAARVAAIAATFENAWDTVRDDAFEAAWAAAWSAALKSRDAAANDAAAKDAAKDAAWATQAAELRRICAEIAAGRDPYPAAGAVIA